MGRKKKSPENSFDKESNPERNADDVRAIAKEFAERTAKMHYKMLAAANRMDEFGENFRVKFILSMLPKFLRDLESRVESQLEKKLSKELGKARAQQMIREIQEREQK
jgi:protein required for attachment to host cells